MKRLQSILCASILTLSLCTAAFAGQIPGAPAPGDITSRTGQIPGAPGQIPGRTGQIPGAPDDISGFDLVSLIIWGILN